MRKWNMWTTKEEEEDEEEEEEAEDKNKHSPQHVRSTPQAFHYIHVHRVFASFTVYVVQ